MVAGWIVRLPDWAMEWFFDDFLRWLERHPDQYDRLLRSAIRRFSASPLEANFVAQMNVREVRADAVRGSGY